MRKTCKTERAAQMESGELLEQAATGRRPDMTAIVPQPTDWHIEVADWDLPTRKANEVCIRRVIKPALVHLPNFQIATMQYALTVLAYEGLIVKLNIKGLRHYTASQLLAARFELRNTTARLGHGNE